MKKLLFIPALILVVISCVYGADMRIQSTERMVGANHPALPDTLNRLVLI